MGSSIYNPYFVLSPIHHLGQTFSLDTKQSDPAETENEGVER